MIVQTRKGENGRKIIRVERPIFGAGSGWNHEIGHYLSVGPLEGRDGVFYTLMLTETDVHEITAAWERGMANRAELDKELGDRESGI